MKLKGHVKAYSRKNKDGACASVYSVTNSQGFIPSTEYFSKEVFSKELRTYKLVERGMIAYNPSRINVGSVAIQDKCERAIVSPLYVVFSVAEEMVDAEYLLRFLKSKPGLEQISFQSTGTVRNNLKFDALERLDVALPALDKQKQCVSKLKSIEIQIKLCEKYLEKLDELVKSRFVEMFGDGRNFEQCEMSNLVSSIVSGTNVSGNQRPIEPGEYAVLKISAVTKGWFKSNEYKVVDDVSSIKMIHPRKGDLLFSRANTSEMVGATAIVDDDYENLFLPDKLWRLDPASDVDVVFLKQVLSSEKVRAEMSKVSTGTSGSMQNISMAKFRKLRAYKPPLSTQKEFASFVSEVDKLKFAAQKQIDELQTLYDSLAQEYFGGQEA